MTTYNECMINNQLIKKKSWYPMLSFFDENTCVQYIDSQN